MTYRSILWEDVEEGQPLPPIRYELSMLRLVAYVRATGLYDYVHLDRDYAQAVGARDVFAATPHVAGLFSRLVTDWSGPEADLRSLSFSMRAQSCCNDDLLVTGKVGRKYRGSDGSFLVDLVDLNIAHDKAPSAAVASATVALPSREGGGVKPAAPDLVGGRSGPSSDVPDFAKSLLGRPKITTRQVRPLTEDEIHLWCEALEDWNPLYWDSPYAAGSRYKGLIAPPTAIFFGTGSSVTAGVGYRKPGSQVPPPVAAGLKGLPLLRALREELLRSNIPLTLPEYPEVVVTETRADYLKPMRPGDIVTLKQELVDCSPKKKTRLGEGYFFTWLESEFNQKAEVLKTLSYKLFYYHP